MISVTFDSLTYRVEEDDRILQPLLILSNPSPFVENVEIATEVFSFPIFNISMYSVLKYVNTYA